MPGRLGVHGGVESNAKISALYAHVMQCHLVWVPWRRGAIKDKADLKWLIIGWLIYWMHLVPLIFLRMPWMTVNQSARRALEPPWPVLCTLFLANKPFLALLAGFSLCWGWRHPAPVQLQTRCLGR